MKLKRLEVAGFKSFAKSSVLVFDEPISAIVGPNGSGKSNIVEAMRFVLGEQSNKSLRSKTSADLLFKGADGIKPSKVAKVSLVFDNSDRAFSLHNEDNTSLDLSYDEISIARQISPDGGDYLINGVSVRLKDVQALIASVNIGASGHHIISQGEADRVLSATPKQRREMVEDALGLKVYQLRIKEAEKKLEKTEANIREIEIQRRELSPHLRYLEREMKKIEEAKKLREELALDYQTYLVAEQSFIASKEKSLADRRSEFVDAVDRLRSERKEAKAVVEQATAHELRTELAKTESALLAVQGQQQKIERSLGQLEGRRTSTTEMLSTLRYSSQESERGEVSFSEMQVRDLTDTLLSSLDELSEEASLVKMHETLGDMRRVLISFWRENAPEKASSNNLKHVGALVKIGEDLAVVESDIKTMLEDGSRLKVERSELEHRLSVQKESLREAERERETSERSLITLQAELQKNESGLEYLDQEQQVLGRRRDRLSDEIEEGKVLVGQQVLQFLKEQVVGETLPEADIDGLRINLERKKLRLETMGASGGKELADAYEEAAERDMFLAGELEDLDKTIKQLQGLLSELGETLRESFSGGVASMSRMFHDFFTAMFGGGQAKLIIEEKLQTEEEELAGVRSESGIGIQVKLPNKKVTEIEMLSGGERSLTSIALLFALSQVNPPPFLVLDETDAALDEANSRRYGDMLERLAKVAQLVVVTHNRETMSRAQNLYGVTMKSGASSVLSIKLEEALEVAK
jgi:chromosome segregation protein